MLCFHDFYICKYYSTKKTKIYKNRYLLQMQPYPWWTLYLEPPFCVRFGILHLITWLKWGSLFLFKIQSSKVCEKLIFPAFGNDFGFGGSLFLFNSSKKVFKNWFFQLLARSWFWWQFFPFTIQFNKYWKFDFFQLLARSWFWRQLVSIQNSIYKNTKYVFPAFGTILFWQQLLSAKNSQKIQKKYKKDTSSKRSHTLGEPYT